MDPAGLLRVSDTEWRLPRQGGMRVPGTLFASEALVRQMDDEVARQVANVAGLPGIVGASMAMPDAHWGYGFPIGGVAAFDPDEGGVVSAGGVGFDIACGVRCHRTGLALPDLGDARERLADLLFARIPAGVGAHGRLHLNRSELDRVLVEGAGWAVRQGYGEPSDLAHVEARGRVEGADPDAVSAAAKDRQQDEVGTLGSGNHYVEVQVVERVVDDVAARAFGLAEGDVVVSLHSGSRGLGHQVCTEYQKRMAGEAPRHGLVLPDRELAAAPLRSDTGRAYLGAMRAAINCALANRQVLGHLVREVFAEVFPGVHLPLLYDVSHNTCQEETHAVGGAKRRLFVHRKGATRSLGPGHRDLPPEYRAVGQPVLIGGSMGTGSWVLAGTREAEERSFASALHGAGRTMSRRQATERWRGEDVVRDLGRHEILVRTVSWRGVAEEAPGAYKDVDAVIEATAAAGLARPVARLRPLIVVKG